MVTKRVTYTHTHTHTHTHTKPKTKKVKVEYVRELILRCLVNSEIWTKSRQNEQWILSREMDRAGYAAANLLNPINFAGTYWYSRPLLQTLHTAGPLNQPVRILVRTLTTD